MNDQILREFMAETEDLLEILFGDLQACAFVMRGTRTPRIGRAHLRPFTHQGVVPPQSNSTA